MIEVSLVVAAASERPFDLEAELKRLPANPGVYRMYDRSGDLLYVGKAKHLKNRVRSYFQKSAAHSPKTLSMVSQIARFDYIVTDSEVEALLLESNLINEFKPKYNILFRDDKKYPWLCITDEPFPRLIVTRDPFRGSRRAKYFGPYISSGDMYATLKLIRKHFPLRQRHTPLFKTRPCMNYHIGTCPGPCQNLISPEEYQKTVRQVELLLKGKTADLLESLHEEMEEASRLMQFEKAAQCRNRIQAVMTVGTQQKVFYKDQTVHQDVLAVTSDALRCMVQVLNVREGKLLGSRSYEVPLTYEATEQEVFSAFLPQFYRGIASEDIPDEILLQHPVEDAEMVQLGISRWAGKPVCLIWPEKGVQKGLLEMAVKNAQESLEKAKLYDAEKIKHDPIPALLELQEALNLPDLPLRIECYDISHFQGSQTVASMVVFSNGQIDKKSYRRFKIRTTEGKPDDFQSMHEVITRRFSHANTEDGWQAPDLVVIDGGKGQLGAAVDALHNLGFHNQPMISLAKKFEEVYLPGQSRPVLLSRDSAALFLLQQIRDEAHRFAITHHRTLRAKVATQSILDDIPGIGPKRRKQLLAYFGSVEKIKRASVEELCQVPGMTKKAAQQVYSAFHAS